MLQGICMNFAIQTKKVLQLAVRKDKWLITQKHWQEEIEEYTGFLKAYIKDFSRSDLVETKKSNAKSELTALLIQFLKEEIEEVEHNLQGMRISILIEKFEMCLALAYGILLSIHGKEDLVPGSLFPMKKEEMNWYLAEYLDNREMAEKAFILTTQGEKIA